MNFKNDHIFNQVRHTSKLYNTNFISQKNVYNLLWYFISQQCYAQRTNRYDGTCLDYSSPSYSKSVDVFFLLWLYRTVPLEECIVFDKIQDLDAKVDNYKSIVPMNLNYAVKKALTEPTVGGTQFPKNWSDEDKAKIALEYAMGRKKIIYRFTLSPVSHKICVL